ncbi:uncharacterized protein LOC105701850 [Orussus abietinus]|uniref:uncharacterized protein LOC105701850 n=1 Tax=Orussus abietinus TaxID=222816 RepID=UPI000625AA16|nr:uncharacterized protein LOC105701850 [Orussus abietinus]
MGKVVAWGILVLVVGVSAALREDLPSERARQVPSPRVRALDSSSERITVRRNQDGAHPERASGPDGKVENVVLENSMPGITAYGLPKRRLQTNGVIQRTRLRGSPLRSTEELLPVGTRSVRSIRDSVDLRAEEAKVFRPLFVYRQQVADRHRVGRGKKPIYGAKRPAPCPRPRFWSTYRV